MSGAAAAKPLEDKGARGSLDLVLRPVRSHNLFEETVGRLGEAIALGVITAGERFPPERDLAEMLGVSRVTVREALRALEQARRIEIRRGRMGGAFVLGRRPERRSAASLRKAMRHLGRNVADLLEYRWAIEPTAAALAAAKADAAGVEHLRRTFEDSLDANPEEFRAADVRVHLAIAEVARSTLVAAGVAEVQAALSDIFLAMPLLAESIRHSHDQHRAVLAAIAAADGGAAREAMEEHLLASEELIRGLA